MSIDPSSIAGEGISERWILHVQFERTRREFHHTAQHVRNGKILFAAAAERQAEYDLTGAVHEKR